MNIWYLGICQVVFLIFACAMIYDELRKEGAVNAFLQVTIGKAFIAIFWIAITILACCFVQVRQILSVVDIIALIVWFVCYMKNVPERLREKKKKATRVWYDIKDTIKK